MKIIPYLEAMVKREASDIYLTTGAYATIKVMGEMEAWQVGEVGQRSDITYVVIGEMEGLDIQGID